MVGAAKETDLQLISDRISGTMRRIYEIVLEMAFINDNDVSINKID